MKRREAGCRRPARASSTKTTSSPRPRPGHGTRTGGAVPRITRLPVG